MKINFLSLNDNLGHQNLAVKLMASKNWITFKEFQELEKMLMKLEDFNTDMIRENNGIEIMFFQIIEQGSEVRVEFE